MRTFKDIGAFLAFMEGMPARMAQAGTQGLEVAAAAIEAEAKAVIGTYQREDTGPFAPWPELADATKADRLRLGFSENDPGRRSGDMEKSIGHQVDGSAASIGSNDDKLVWFDQGSGVSSRNAGEGPDGRIQPPRSVLGVAAVRRVDMAVDAIAGRVAAALAGKP